MLPTPVRTSLMTLQFIDQCRASELGKEGMNRNAGGR